MSACIHLQRLTTIYLLRDLILQYKWVCFIVLVITHIRHTVLYEQIVGIQKSFDKGWFDVERLKMFYLLYHVRYMIVMYILKVDTLMWVEEEKIHTLLYVYNVYILLYIWRENEAKTFRSWQIQFHTCFHICTVHCTVYMGP